MVRHLLPFRKYWKLSLLFGILLLTLVFFYTLKYWSREDNVFEEAWLVIEPVATIATFITTIVIFYLQAKSSWENDLEKSFTIQYFYENEVGEKQLLLVIENAYLSGESDIRPWAQQLGGQVFGRLELDIAWDEEPPVIKKIGDEYFKTYQIDLFLPFNPFEDKKLVNKEIASFLKRKPAKSRIIYEAGKLPIVWKRVGQ